ncbi:MAG: serine hydrolase [Candidatus Methanomethylicia archaeon]|nr:serine hydrolase [Candidatus Methanomethylicia archaeon]
MKNIGELREYINRIIPKLMEKTNTPGLSIAIVKGEEIIYSDAFGARDLEENTPATINTLYGFGSCTKSMTALAIMQLKERGEIDLDDEVSKYVPLKIGMPGKPIKIKHLLSNSSGIPSLNTAVISLRKATGIKDIFIPMSSMEDFYRFVNNAQEEIVSEPGKRYFYLNEGYTILGDIIERLSGMEYHEYIKKYILKPLKMERSTFIKEEFEKDLDKITPYWKGRDGKTIKVKMPFDKLIHAAGGLVSSVIEFSKYVIASMNNGRLGNIELASLDSIMEMQKIHIERPKTYYGREGYGYGWGIIEDFFGRKLIGHSGSTGCSSAYTAFIPEEKIGIVMASNTTGFPYMAVAHTILALMMGKKEEEVPVIRIQKKMDMLTGVYEGYGGVIRMNVVNRGGILYLEQKDEFTDMSIPLIPEKDNLEDLTFYIWSNGVRQPIEFTISKDGKIDLYIERNRLHKVKSL